MENQKSFRAIEQEEIINGVKAWKLVSPDCTEIEKLYSLEEAVKESNFNLVIETLVGTYHKELENNDFVYYKIDGDEDICMFRVDDYTLASDNYFAQNSIMIDLIAGNFTWLNTGLVSILKDIVNEDSVDEDDDHTLCNFLESLPVVDTYKGVHIFSNNEINLKIAIDRIENFINEGFEPIDYYINDEGDIFHGTDSYHAFIPVEDTEEVNLTINQAIKFIASKGK